MKGDPIPAQHFIARHCRYSDLVYLGGQLVGVNETAFQPRSGEIDGLSVNWADFFRGGMPHNVTCVRSVTKLHAKDSHRIAVIQVGGLQQAAAPIAALTVAHDPDDELPPDNNAAHALIGPIPDLSNKQIRQRIAAKIKPADLYPYR
jgi:hypothetical protein